MTVVTVGHENTPLVECNVAECLTFFVDNDGKAQDLLSKVYTINESEISHVQVFGHVYYRL